MRRLGRLVAAAALLAGALVAVSAGLATGAASASAEGGTGCTGYNVGGNSWAVECTNGAGYGTGGGGSGVDVCTYYTLAEAEKLFLVSAVVAAEYKAPAGYVYLLQQCPEQYFGDPQILLFADGGKLTTQDLAEQAYAELSPPTLSVGTAPPSGQDGLVGLPEWFWIDGADYLTLSRTVSLAGLSATVIAKPGPLVINPGNGQGSFTCPGPGTPYNPAESAASQQSSCTFLYTQPSAGQPGNEFTVTVSVTWTATWTGTGGTGGTLAPITRTSTIELPIAQAEAVYSGAAG
jgi:hypothetical protein